MKSTAIALACSLIGLAGSSLACTVQVGNVADLDKAIAEATPGYVICLKPGFYDAVEGTDKTIKFSDKRGLPNNPITLRGQAGVFITNTGSNFGLHIVNSSYLKIEKFTISDVTKAIVLDGSTHVSIEHITATRVAEEAIHFRKSSTHNVLINSVVNNTGADTINGHAARKRFGEAVYVGSAKSNWKNIMGNAETPDASHNNCISGNILGPNVAAEAVDVKEGTTNTYILSNTFNLSGISGYNYGDSALDLKGTLTFVGHNKFINPQATYLAKLLRIDKGEDVQIDAPGKLNGKITPDAIQTHIVPTNPDVGSGSNNVIWNNLADLKSAGRPDGYSQGMLLRIDDDKGSPDAQGTRLCGGNAVGKDDLLSNIPEAACTDVPAITACPLVLTMPL